MKDISSYPGASKFRSIIAVILVILFIALFLNYTQRWEDEIEEVSINQITIDIKSALALALYKVVIEGRQDKLGDLDGENPFILLAYSKKLPPNYYGIVSTQLEIDATGGWFFDLSTRKVVYVYRDGKRKKYFRMELKYNDMNGNGQFDHRVDRNYFLNFVEE